MKSDFENLTINNICSLVKLLASTETEEPRYLRKRFEKKALGYESTVGFLKNLKLLESDENTIKRTPRFQTIPSKVFENDSYLHKYLIDLVINSQNPISDAVREYLSRFHLNRESLLYRPSTKQRLQDSEIRNLLIEFGIVEPIASDKLYRIADDYIHLFAEKFRALYQSPQELGFLLKKQQEIGDAAELEVLEYEKNRLAKRPDLVKKVRHISREYVNAGYDIKSFELNSTLSTPLVRFIEVKAVSITGYRFFWSRNEIEKAKKFEDRYYLYLLPVIGNDSFDTLNLDIVPYAYNKVFKECDMWARQEELYSVWKTT